MIDHVLSNGAFWTVNKHLAKIIGIKESLLLSDLISKSSYFSSRNELDKEGYFFNTEKAIEQDTTLSAYEQRQSIKKLEKFGVIETKRKGIPAKKYFKINELMIEELLRTSPLKIKELDIKKLKDKTLKNSRTSHLKIKGLYNKNKDNKNKDNDNKNNDNKDITTQNKILGNNICVGDIKYTIPDKYKLIQKKHIILANKLKTIIEDNKDINIQKHTIVQWADEIRKLIEVDLKSKRKNPIQNIKNILAWYKKNIGGDFIPIVESGSSFRKKFIRLEEAKKRQSNPPNNKPELRNGYVDPHAFEDDTTPDIIITRKNGKITETKVKKDEN